MVPVGDAREDNLLEVREDAREWFRLLGRRCWKGTADVAGLHLREHRETFGRREVVRNPVGNPMGLAAEVLRIHVAVGRRTFEGGVGSVIRGSGLGTRASAFGSIAGGAPRVPNPESRTPTHFFSTSTDTGDDRRTVTTAPAGSVAALRSPAITTAVPPAAPAVLPTIAPFLPPISAPRIAPPTVAPPSCGRCRRPAIRPRG